MTPLNHLENMTCNLDGFNVSPSVHENVFCRIGSTIGISMDFSFLNLVKCS